MKVLLDESVPRQLKLALAMFETLTLKDKGWLGTKNGKLLAKTNDDNFNVFITVDKNLQFQQNIAKLNFGILVINTRYVKWEFIEPLVPRIIKIIESNIEKGSVIVIDEKL